MNAPSASQLVDVFVVLLPAVAQAAIAWQQRRTRRGAAAERAIARWLPHPGIPMALAYALGAVAHHLLREPAGALPSAGRIAASVSIDVLMILGLAGYVHLARNQAHPEAPPGRRWLAVHYGVAVALCLLAATFPDVIPLPIFAQQQRAYEAAFLAYYLTSTGRILGFLVGPSGARPGVAPFALGMALAGGGWVLLEMAGAPKLVAPLVAAIGLAFAVPFAAGRVQRLVRVMLGVAGAVAAWRVARAGLDALAALAAAGQSLAGPPPLALATAGVSALLGLAWSTCARRAFRARERAGTSAPLAGIVAVLMVCMALFSALNATCWLFAMPALPVPPWLSALYFLHDWTLLAAAALVIHLALLLPGDAARPTARQVAFGYAVAGIVAIGGVLLFDLLPSLPLEQRIRVYVALQNLYIMAAVTFVVSRMVRLVRPGRWRPNQVCSAEG